MQVKNSFNGQKNCVCGFSLYDMTESQGIYDSFSVNALQVINPVLGCIERL